jgi:hypothetical protein
MIGGTMPMQYPIWICRSNGQSKKRYIAGAASVATVLVALFGFDPQAFAQRSERTVVEPPRANIERGPTRLGTRFTTLAAPLAPAAVAGEVFLDLNIQYTDAKIYNPATDRPDSVRLRSYRDVRETNPPTIPSLPRRSRLIQARPYG